MIDNIGRVNVTNLIIHLFKLGLFDKGTPSTEDLNMDKVDLRMCNSDKIIDIYKSLKQFSPIRKRDDLSAFEIMNWEYILAAVLRNRKDQIPLHINSNFRLVREIAKYRLQINK